MTKSVFKSEDYIFLDIEGWMFLEIYDFWLFSIDYVFLVFNLDVFIVFIIVVTTKILDILNYTISI